MLLSVISFFFFFNDTATTEIYTLSLHDALPIYLDWGSWEGSLPESSSLGGDGRPLRGASFMDATSSIRDSRTHCGKNSINFAGTATLSSPSTRGGLAYSGPPKWPCLSPPPATDPVAGHQGDVSVQQEIGS